MNVSEINILRTLLKHSIFVIRCKRTPVTLFQCEQYLLEITVNGRSAYLIQRQCCTTFASYFDEHLYIDRCEKR